MQPETWKLLIENILLAVVNFFVVAPLMLNTIAMFTVDKKFRKKMVELDIIPEEETKKVQKGKMIAGTAITIVFVAAIVFVAYSDLFRILSSALPALFGAFKYRNILEYNSNTVKRFKSSYSLYMDNKKFNKFIEKEF